MLNIKLKMMNKKIKFIDLFAGLGGIRIGFEQACKERGIETECVLTSEIKPYAVETLKHNHHHNNFIGDIFQLKNEGIPDFLVNHLAQEEKEMVLQIQEELCFLKLKEF
jgi:site-specific DNA-cytosine methylase